jgi:hypothetical protein
MTKSKQDHSRGAEGETVDAGRVDVHPLCLRWIEWRAFDDGPAARFSCVCAGEGCPHDPRSYARARAVAERDLRLTLEVERTARLGERGARRG